MDSFDGSFSLVFPSILLFCSFTSLVAVYCGKKRGKKHKGRKIATKKNSGGCCGCCRRKKVKAPRHSGQKKVRTPSKSKTPSPRITEKVRPGHAKKNDYMTLGNIDVDIFKKMDVNKKRHSDSKKLPVQKTQEDNTKTASLWSSQDESPSDQLAEISKRESQKSRKSVSKRELLPSKVPKLSPEREVGPSKNGRPRPDSLPEATKTAKIKNNEEVKIDKQSRVRHSAEENKREKQRVFKLLEAKINAVLKEEKSKDEKKEKDKKSGVTKGKEPKKDTESSKEEENKDKNQKKEQKIENEKQDSDSSSESIRRSRDGRSETEKISIMQPIILDSEIESGMTISMKSEVSESTTEANMNN
uniref:Candidate secreted effector n=1 Tax=Meloidogyne incognita TaxID=6306 RepID=A0A914L690_MELIC